jgi:hypothetical protein
MKRWIRNTLLGLCGLLAIAGAAYYWFFVESHVPSGAEYALDIGEVRRLAGAAAGDEPIAIEVERVGLFTPPATFVVAGDGWKPTDDGVSNSCQHQRSANCSPDAQVCSGDRPNTTAVKVTALSGSCCRPSRPCPVCIICTSGL